jgi:hypothetical protein
MGVDSIFPIDLFNVFCFGFGPFFSLLLGFVFSELEPVWQMILLSGVVVW